MKILLASCSGIYDSNYKDTRKNNSGFGHMIRELADLLTSEGDSVDIITQSNITSGHEIGKAYLVKRTPIMLIRQLKWMYVVCAFKLIGQHDYSIGSFLRAILYFCTGSYSENLIMREKYDVVHINGIGVGALPYMYACIRTNTPYVLTLHGVISGVTVQTQVINKKIERLFMELIAKTFSVNITTVSTGTRSRFCNMAGIELENITVVCNPVIKGLKDDRNCVDNSNVKSIVCVGNVSKRKNQEMVIEAFEILKSRFNRTYILYIIGGNEVELKERYRRSEDIIFTGQLPHDEVGQYYVNADLCVTATLDEGFGLPIIEAYSYGVPCVFPKGIDAYRDVYDDECSVTVDDLTTENLAISMNNALNREWDRNKIINYSSKFSETNCAKKYLSILRNATKDRTTCNQLPALEYLYSQAIKKTVD